MLHTIQLSYRFTIRGILVVVVAVAAAVVHVVSSLKMGQINPLSVS